MVEGLVVLLLTCGVGTVRALGAGWGIGLVGEGGYLRGQDGTVTYCAESLRGGEVGLRLDVRRVSSGNGSSSDNRPVGDMTCRKGACTVKPG